MGMLPHVLICSYIISPDRRTGPDPDPDRTRTGVTSAEQRLPIMDQGSWIMDHGSWIMEHGPCSGMNDHPRRDTDVRSRPSESTIKDLSFYIGFIKIQSSNKYLGPCSGMNDHPGRDTDLRSRPSESTI